ncbi:MAG: glycosyltransferase [Pseudonocardia sp.]|nr:glycosyltransferase [Pseudonocardia sp.]MBO0876032.1 glycosyltransferase [Pseudonocardia sp.]
MKIAMVSEHASPLARLGGADAGGQNVHVAELSSALGAAGHEVVVYTRRADPDQPRRRPLRPGVTVEHVTAGPVGPLPRDELYRHMGEFADNLRSSWRAAEPDVVHAHFWMSGLAALRAAPPGMPVAQTFHALGVVKQRHQGDQDTSPPERIEAELDIANEVDRVVATCSDEVFELVRQGVSRRRISIVPSGVDVEALHSDEVPPPKGAGHRLVVLGRLVPRKGIDDVIRALPQVADTELIVAGGPPAEKLADDPNGRRLRALAERCGVADRVRLVGGVQRDTIRSLLVSADAVVCVPWYEPFGIVPLEAMACGVPVVASAVGGLTDTVVHGVTGLHVPPRDPAALAAVLRELLADPGLGVAFGVAGRKRAVARYSWPRVATDTMRIYQRMCDRSVRRSPVTTAAGGT